MFQRSLLVPRLKMSTHFWTGGICVLNSAAWVWLPRKKNFCSRSSNGAGKQRGTCSKWGSVFPGSASAAVLYIRYLVRSRYHCAWRFHIQVARKVLSAYLCKHVPLKVRLMCSRKQSVQIAKKMNNFFHPLFLTFKNLVNSPAAKAFWSCMQLRICTPDHPPTSLHL